MKFCDEFFIDRFRVEHQKGQLIFHGLLYRMLIHIISKTFRITKLIVKLG